MVARGMIRLGSLDSSPYIAVDSKPTHDQKAKNRPRPALAPATARRGERADGVERLGDGEAVGTATLEQHRHAPSDSSHLGHEEHPEHLGATG